MQLSDFALFRQQCFIDGHWVASENGKTSTVTNPFDGAVLGTVPELTPDQVKRAIASAQEAQRSWAKETAATRSGVL
ncbi:aldehyde dehydrogenase family protein, partial [Vibrio fluvialis]